MKKVQGFLTRDGTFYNNEEAAELHEAEKVLHDAIEARNIEPAPILELLDDLHAEATRYIKAKVANLSRRSEDARTRKQPSATEVDKTNNKGRRQGVASVQQQPSGGDQSVPNVGRRARTKAIQDTSEKHGA